MAASFGMSAYLFQSGTMTLGSVYLVIHYTGLLNRPIQRIAQEIEQLQQAGAGVARIQEFLAENNRLAPPLSERLLPQGPLSISFEDVSFSYPTESRSYLDKSLNAESSASSAVLSQMEKSDSPQIEKNGDNSVDRSVTHLGQPLAVEPSRNGHASNGLTDTNSEIVLDAVTFRLESGKVLGLLGRTGSGKTTLARLLFRFYDPTAGRVYIGGEDIAHLNMHELRQRIGVVTQNVQLFRASVRENMAFFNPTIPDSALLNVLDELGLSDWLATLEDGLDTVLDAGGGNLSAGEAQLLALTRIFLKDPDIVIFDEASSRLDPATEQRIERAVNRLLQNRTAIIIAHRLATIQRADDILILERGKIVEHGKRVMLSADPNSRFAGLLRSGFKRIDSLQSTTNSQGTI
ncbi:ABC transporter ATP-binding protein/permease [Chloroflexi bacterium TSY]|nr:ABC transporter ATP-binding protein/permease [Chloroflexi bacterium TSY]